MTQLYQSKKPVRKFDKHESKLFVFEIEYVRNGIYKQ